MLRSGAKSSAYDGYDNVAQVYLFVTVFFKLLIMPIGYRAPFVQNRFIA